ncbi:MAG: 50S ribosomal protein L19 [Planctomycetota bacterium]
MDVMDKIEAKFIDPTKNSKHFGVGDTVEVHVRIKEGDKERIQIFRGVVISKAKSGMREVFRVRKLVAGEGVERTFPVQSPAVLKVVCTRHGKVRRAKLYYLRDRVGKQTRIQERILAKQVEVPETAPPSVPEVTATATAPAPVTTAPVQPEKK